MKTRKFGGQGRGEEGGTEGGVNETASMLLEVGDGTHGAGGRRRRGFTVPVGSRSHAGRSRGRLFIA